jgi:hypothetical protein
MNKYYAEVNGKIEFFDKLPYRTYFMYGEDGIEHKGNAYLSHTKLDGGKCLTPIYETKTKKIYKRLEYAGLELCNILDFKE